MSRVGEVDSGRGASARKCRPVTWEFGSLAALQPWSHVKRADKPHRTGCPLVDRISQVSCPTSTLTCTGLRWPRCPAPTCFLVSGSSQEALNNLLVVVVVGEDFMKPRNRAREKPCCAAVADLAQGLLRACSRNSSAY